MENYTDFRLRKLKESPDRAEAALQVGFDEYMKDGNIDAFLETLRIIINAKNATSANHSCWNFNFKWQKL